jgi:LemA protein
MKKVWLIVIVVVVFLFLLISWGVKSYNRLITTQEDVGSQWSKVENAYQRRLDLIPNIQRIVQSYANFEKSTLTQVVEARAKASSMTISPQNLNAESIKQFEQAQSNFSSSLSRLLVVFERYPDLKANQNYLEFQAQLEGTENRIKVERDKFADMVRNYNVSLRRFPTSIIASAFGFSKKQYFESEQTDIKPKSKNYEGVNMQ